MSNLKSLLMLLGVGMLLISCDAESDDAPLVLNAGTLSGGPFTFTVDGTPDMVSGITLDDSDVVGINRGYVITDDTGKILGLPPTLADVEGVNFDGAGAGVCFIWHIVYETGLSGLEMGENTDGLSGEYELSNSIMVTRNGLNAGILAGGPFTFTVDGTPDMVSGITLDDTDLNGTNQTYVITDDQNKILGLPPTLTDVEGVNFDGAGAGVCFIWHLTYEEGLSGLEAGENVAGFSGNYALSNSIMVTRNGLNAGMLSGGPFTFTVDGTPDMVSGITLDDAELNGTNQTYVITDDQNKILGLPPSLEAVEGVDFDAAGAGTCFIWHLTYEDNLEGLEAGKNVADFSGNYALSNSIKVTRNALQSTSFKVTIENVFQPRSYFANGTTGLIQPGNSESITFNAGVGHYLSFATMFVQSNDLFFAPDEGGIALYDSNGYAKTGNITHKIELWDAGTEVNEEPGVGPNQAPRQSGPNTGDAENGTVELIQNINDGYSYPAVSETIKVKLEHDGGTQFTLTIHNISNTCSIATPFAPGTWVIHSGGQTPLFVEGEPASEGLEDIAEDGDVSISDAELSAASGLVSPFAPGAYEINGQVFTTGEVSSAAFEALAEDGNPSGYDNVFNTPVGAGGPAPIFPGEAYSFEFTGQAGDVLSLATMLVQSNDWVVGANNIALFDGDTALSGDITYKFSIYDSGTEVDEYPGAGANQAPRQSGPNTGKDENGYVALETDIPANVPAIADMIKITITAN
ncbi:spondin domain-containing protein [Flagellimonas sp. S3867]|uniref:spondin domain-containing protein n=1 Tax=Flagellimonas sp. S3867 TaxID=2768063 RepID=UPI0016876C87|nr:spondin domain-containing protein [Flagellimonas sp. S3867]